MAATTTASKIKSEIGNITAKKVSLRLPPKCGRSGFRKIADPKVPSPNPTIDASTNSRIVSFREAIKSRGNEMRTIG